MTTVKGWVLVEPGRLELEGDRVVPDPSPVEVRLEVKEVGGCTSELDRYLGRAPHEPREQIGHEIAGRIVEVGSLVTEHRVGDRVAVQADGGYAEEVVVPASWCVPVPDSIVHPSIVEAAGCVVAAVEQVGQRLGDTVVIVGGTGSMGELLQRVAKAKTPGLLIVTGRRSHALELARNEVGAHVVNTDRESAEELVMGLTGGRGADVAYDVAGVEESCRLACQVLAPEGVVAQVAFPQGDLLKPEGLIIGKRLRTENCHFTKQKLVPAMRQAVKLLELGVLDSSTLVSDVVEFDDLPDGFALAASKQPGFRRWVAHIADW